MTCSMQLLPRTCLFIRTYSAFTKRRPSKRFKDPVSLEYFLQRGKVLTLWRDIIRGCRRISDENTKQETLRFAREEFQRHKKVQDIIHIRYLVSTGKTQWESMERYIDGL